MIKIQKHLKEHFELLWKSKPGLTNQLSWSFFGKDDINSLQCVNKNWTTTIKRNQNLSGQHWVYLSISTLDSVYGSKKPDSVRVEF